MTWQESVLVFVIGYIIGNFIMALFCWCERKKKEVEEHNKKMRAKEAKTGVVYIDYRFIVKAKNTIEASEKVAKFLPEATDGLWYTQTRSSYKAD